MKKAKSKNGRKRAGKGQGRLYKRDTAGTEHPADWNGAGTFWLAYVVNGKRVRQMLRDSDGHSITDRDAAEVERKRITAPLQTGDRAETLKAIAARVQAAEAAHVQAVDEANPPLQIKETWSAYVQAQNRPDTGKATLAVYELTWGRFCKWMTDTHPTVTAMRDVTPDIAGQFAAWLTSEGRSPNTFNKYMNVMALVFRTVKDKARITDNVWDGIARKRLVTHGRRELTIDELRTVTAAAKDDLRVLLALGIYTGLRLGDCSTLRWAEIDLARNRIVRIPNKTGRSNPKPVLVPLHPTLRAMLEEIPTAARTGYVLPRIATDYARNSTYVTDRVQALFEKCGIQTRRNVEGRLLAQVEVGFHSLRHSFVSLCREANAPLAVVEAIVGHSNPAMTRHYTHTSEAAAMAAVASLPSITGEQPKALPRREPLPTWALELIEKLTAENVQEIKAALTKGGAT